MVQDTWNVPELSASKSGRADRPVAEIGLLYTKAPSTTGEGLTNLGPVA
jgi:hypothetical protein